LAELVFLQDYIPNVWNHTRSLAVEEHFYLLLAFGFGALTRVFPRARSF
jgi:peptidoglycan/LPS O-acetylase OafA/YrhL